MGIGNSNSYIAYKKEWRKLCDWLSPLYIKMGVVFGNLFNGSCKVGGMVYKMKSIKDKLLYYFILMIIGTIVCFSFYGIFSVWMYEKELSYCDEKTLDLYSNSFEYELDSLEDFLQNMTTNNNYFMLLSLKGGISIDKKIEAEYLTREVIQSEVKDSSALFYYSKNGNEFYYRTGKQFRREIYGAELRNFMKEASQDFLAMNESDYRYWKIMDIGGKKILTNTYHSGDLYMTAMVDLDACVEEFSGNEKEYFFYNQDQVLASSNRLLFQKIDGNKILREDVSGNGEHTYHWIRKKGGSIVQARFFDDYGLGLCIVSKMEGIWKLSSVAMILLVFLVIALLAFFLLVYGYVKKATVYPLERISELSDQMRESGRRMRKKLLEEPESAVHLEASDSDGIREYAKISEALNELVDQKIELEQENEARQREKNQALLQYYQLQTRSHFFLNCLKSLYNMANTGEIEKMKMMILGFSNHLRFIFRDNLKLIPLKDEIAELNDYQSIIQMDSAKPIVLDMSVPDEAMDCLVPPLLIQTFLENSYKYSNTKTGMLCFRVHAEISDAADRKYLHMKISDNGAGYSNEVLRALADDSEEYKQYHVGIANLKRRMKLIYGKECQTAFFNLPGSGACSVLYIPIRNEENNHEKREH